MPGSRLETHPGKPYRMVGTSGGLIQVKRLTITIDADVYDGLHAVVGRNRISRFINDLARPFVVGKDIRAGYAAMAADEAREDEARDWIDGLIDDVATEPSRGG